MKQGVHYAQTYAPVASWSSVRPLLTLAAVHSRHTTQLNYVLAYPQAQVEYEIYMETPKWIVHKLHENVYGQKQARRVWNQYLVDCLVNQVVSSNQKLMNASFIETT